MKKLHWTKLKPNQLRGTVFEGMHPEKWELEYDRLEELFTSKRPQSKSAGASGAPAKPKKVLLLDGKKSNGVGILLARFKLPPEAIREAILDLNTHVITEDTVGNLIKYLPTGDEVETLSSYDGDPGLLGKSEVFIMAIMDIPRLGPRLESLRVKLQFEERSADVTTGLTMMEAAITGVLESQALQKLMELVLAVGNFMNGKPGPRGDKGFKLAFLNKLRDTKSADNKTTLLHYLVEYVESSHSEVLVFLDDLKHVEEGARHSLDLLKSSVAELDVSLKGIGKELEAVAPTDRFVEVMGVFYEGATQAVSDMQSSLHTIEATYEKAAKAYGEIPSKVKAEEFLSKFHDFEEAFVKAQRDNARAKERAEKKARRDAAKAAAKAKRASSRTSSRTSEARA